MKNGVFVDQTGQYIIRVNGDTGSSFRGWKQVKKYDQRPDKIWNHMPSYCWLQQFFAGAGGDHTIP